MTSVLAARSAAAATLASSALSRPAPGVIRYSEEVEAVGFEVLPAEVRAGVADLLAGVELAADADHPRARRRPDGGCYQLAAGWWASAACLVTVEARRDLAELPDGRFRPVGGWSTLASVDWLPVGVQPVTSRWRSQADGTGPGQPARARSVSDFLDVLPPAVVAPLRVAAGCRRGTWRDECVGWVREIIVAQLVAGDRVRVLSARRTAGSCRRLAQADWVITTLDAPIVGRQRFQVAPRGRPHQVATDPACQLPRDPPG